MKKKILTLTLTAVLILTLAFTLTSCGGPKTFTVAEFSIDLNSSYFDVTSIIPVGEDVETFAAYLSLTEGMIVSATKAPDLYDTSLTRYVHEFADRLGGTVSMNEDGIYTVKCDIEAEGQSFSNISYIYDRNDCFWVATFMALSGDISEKSADIEAYVDTIVFE